MKLFTHQSAQYDFRAADFHLVESDEIFPGYDRGEIVNTWDVPYFTRDVLAHVVEYLNEHTSGLFKAGYDAHLDSFWLYQDDFETYSSPDGVPSFERIYYGRRNVNGEDVWPFGVPELAWMRTDD